MPDPRAGLTGHLRRRQTRKEAEDLRRLSRLLGATAASARHTAIINAIEHVQAATSMKDLGTRLGTLEAEARIILVEANKAAGLKGEPRPIPGKGQEPGGLWVPPGTVRPEKAG